MLAFRLWPCCPGRGNVAPFPEHMSGLREPDGNVWTTGAHLPAPQGTPVVQAPYHPVLSRAWALGARYTPHWAWASQLLKASYHVGAPGLTPQDPFNEGRTSGADTHWPCVSGPQG